MTCHCISLIGDTFGKVSDLEGYTTADIRRLGPDLKYSWREFGLLTGVALGLDQNREVDLQHTHLTGFGVQLRNHKLADGPLHDTIS